MVYFVHRFNFIGDSQVTFLSFKVSPIIKYSDGLVLYILYLTFIPKKFLRRTNRNENIPKLIEDNLNLTEGSRDIFRRDSYASYISKLVLNQTVRNSFAIGIRGSWGSGKSVFLRQIENNIYNVIKIRFNPWLSKSTDEVLGDFFKILIDRTSEFDNSLSRNFRKYYSNLVNLDENMGSKLFSSIGILKQDKGQSLEEQQKEIVNRLKKDRLKIVVFIDDLDRLNADEILSVLKLIRNSFNFPNTFFLIAYDDLYLRKTLRDKIHKPDKFLEKIFQLDIDLPSFPFDLLQNQVIELLVVNKTDSQKEHITRAIQSIGDSGVFSKIIQNLRDAVRFSNSFNHIYWKKEAEVDLFDFILLELLKIKFRATYEEVRSALISSADVNYIKISKDEFNPSSRIKLLGTKQLNTDNPAYPLLHLLFNRENNFDEVKSITLPGNSIRYFSDDLFGIISYAEFENYKGESFLGFKALIDDQFNKGNIEELINKILRINRFPNSNSFFNINKGLLYISNLKFNYQYTDIVYNNFETNYSAISKSIQNDESIKKYVERLFYDEYKDALAESQVLGRLLLRQMTDASGSAVMSDLDITFLKEMLIKNLADFAKKYHDGFDTRVFDIYYQVRESVQGGTVYINSRANLIMRDYVLSNQKTFFKEWLIRPKYLGKVDTKIYVLEPFIDQYLGYGEFERLLYEQSSSLDVLKVQSFFKKYKAANYSEAEYSPLVIEIFSDERTRFLESPSYNNLSSGPAVVRKQPGKIVFSNRHESLKGSEWIAHTAEITQLEAQKGGIYIFSVEFSLSGLKVSLRNAKMYFLVDDFLKVDINSEDFGGEYSGVNLEKPLEIDLTRVLSMDSNRILFFVGNVEGEKEWPDAVVTAENNPYDFIYKIIIELDGSGG
jgi:hypothetical protein